MSIHPTPWHIPAATGPARIRDAAGDLVCTVGDAGTARRIVAAVNAASRPPGPLVVGGETVGEVHADGSIVFAPGYAVHSLVSDANEPPEAERQQRNPNEIEHDA